jgi:hypothetical protein
MNPTVQELTTERHRQLAKTLKRILLLTSSEIGDIRDKHIFLKEADRFIMQAASKIEDYLRATE